MKNYTLFIATVPFAKPTEQSKPIVVTVPNNAIPLQAEYASTGQAFHFLVPCDEKGVPIEEVIAPEVYEAAWGELYKLFGERLEQDNLEVMDSVLKGVMSEVEGEKEAVAAGIVLVCVGGCGKTTEGMTMESKVGEFKEVDGSGVPEWTCPECLAKKQAEEQI